MLGPVSEDEVDRMCLVQLKFAVASLVQEQKSFWKSQEYTDGPKTDSGK